MPEDSLIPGHTQQGRLVMNAKISIAEFFSWRHHPFADTYSLKQPFLSHKDKRIMDKALSLLSYGKSFAVTGPSGSGKSTLAQHIISSLDPHHYRPILIPYGGLQRGGILKAIADLPRWCGCIRSKCTASDKTPKHMLNDIMRTAASFPSSSLMTPSSWSAIPCWTSAR